MAGNAVPSGRNTKDPMVKYTKAVAIFTGLLFGTSFISDGFIAWQIYTSGQSDSEKIDQSRAIIAFTGGFVSPANPVNNQPTASAIFGRFHNFGTTRTTHFEGWISAHYFVDGIPNSQDFTKPYQQITQLDNVVGGGSDILVGPVAVFNDDITSVQNGRGSIAVWGHARYSDVYDRKKTKDVNFCLTVAVDKSPQGQQISSLIPLRSDCNTNSDSQ